MNLQCKVELGLNYKAGTQIARVISEDWCRRELYCAACSSDRLSASRPNTPAIDFACPECDQCFQLKSFKTWNRKKIPDAAYDSMIRAIKSDRVPNLLVLQYSTDWLVKNLMLVPRVFFSESVIEKRPPLSPTAQRAGWIGCNILLDRIPRDGKIPIVTNGSTVAEQQVREEFSRIKKLAEVPPAIRGWTLDVLTTVRKLSKARFSLQELYQLEPYLQNLHPQNRNVRAKIRQQLQVLRDLGLIEFTGPGNYLVRAANSPGPVL
jgi:type II restriction enzyme